MKINVSKESPNSNSPPNSHASSEQAEIVEEVIADLSDLTESALIEPGLGSDCYAAVDLGSNSFHLVISRYQHGEFTVIDRQKEVIRLAAGLDQNNHLSEEVATRALGCLSRFGQLLRNLPNENIRAVGTNALRRLQGKNHFLERAETALGQNIEIIAGREEARLIYLGVSKWSTGSDESRLVIDIGGGSTEIIVGRGDTPKCRESLEVGCVVLSKQVFADGVLSRKRFNEAILSAELAIQPVVSQFKLEGWADVIGCSGTMKSMSQAMIAGGWSRDGINREGLTRLRDHAIKAGHLDELSVPGVSRERLPVFAGGLSILIALFELFDIREMSVSDIALREGVLYDLVGRSSAEDIRNVTVSAMLAKWSVDLEHCRKVCDTALNLYGHANVTWDIQDRLFEDSLTWAAQLHEIGLQISHDGYHSHGAYLVANGDMAGFTKREQLLLAALIVGHRRKFPLGKFESLPSTLVTPAKRIAIILRLAVLLHRGRAAELPEVSHFSAQGKQVELDFEEGWLERNPLTGADLNQEQIWLKNIGIRLQFR